MISSSVRSPILALVPVQIDFKVSLWWLISSTEVQLGKKIMAPADKETAGFFFFFKCHKLYFLNVKSPHFRVCYVFCGISKLCLGTSYLNFSVVLSSFRIMVLGRYFAGFAPARGTQLWKPCTAKAGSIAGSLPVDLGWLPFNSQLWKFWWCQHLIGF